MVAKYDGKFGAPEADEEKKDLNNVYRWTAMSGGKKTTTRISTSWYAEVDIMKGLTGKINANYQDYSHITDTYSKHTEGYSFRKDKVIVSTPTLDAATVNFAMDRRYEYTLTGTLNYMNTFGDHDINVLAGYEQYYYNTRTDNAQKKGLMDFSIHDMQSASEMVYINYHKDNDLSERDYGMLSYFGRINYAYKGRYLLEANVRRDGSSRFSPDNRWGTFPSFSLGWRISEESFMENTRSWLSNLKLRASWGKLGNVTSGYYDWQSVYSIINSSFGGNISNGLAVTKVGNPIIQWENINSTGIGLDASFLNNKLTLEVDFYNKVTEGILTNPTMPFTMGLATAPTQNTADLRNRGLEVTLGWNDRIKDFQYGANINFSYNQNKVTKYLGKFEAGWNDKGEYTSNIGKSATTQNNGIRTEGHMFDEYYMLQRYKGTGKYKDGSGNVDPLGGPRDGMIRTPEDLQWVKDMIAAGYSFQPKSTVGRGQLNYGEYIYADENGDKIFGNTHDRVFTGKSSMPKYTLGINLNAAWKGFDMSMTWAGSFGMYYYMYERGINATNVTDGEQIASNFKQYYYYNENNPNDPLNNINAKYPSLKYGTGSLGNQAVNTTNLYNGSYLKLKTLQIGYSLPNSLVAKMRMQKLRVFLAGENLLTITDFPGMDPEIGASVNKYPLNKQLSAGVNITF
ncbi:SusC/RagA family TonB-linked outer membrane protein [Bacteroides sp. 519]|uniref:SusC/RagA family TonB-linked outer membrane protein n=1 Tax=Bacteroides sp. 519 TaxID=2302937 RepID=UPI0013D25064|nr:SusC/RagA family TonB-linked outer membrane protein [Bacteroides sp. 519]NDV60497.1 SusC/RagA family TonB-linked outer membrane protein [Bacteroides sp. 519]